MVPAGPPRTRGRGGVRSRAGGLWWPSVSPGHSVARVRVPCGHRYGQSISASHGDRLGHRRAMGTAYPTPTGRSGGRFIVSAVSGWLGRPPRDERPRHRTWWPAEWRASKSHTPRASAMGCRRPLWGQAASGRRYRQGYGVRHALVLARPPRTCGWDGVLGHARGLATRDPSSLYSPTKPHSSIQFASSTRYVIRVKSIIWPTTSAPSSYIR